MDGRATAQQQHHFVAHHLERYPRFAREGQLHEMLEIVD